MMHFPKWRPPNPLWRVVLPVVLLVLAPLLPTPVQAAGETIFVDGAEGTPPCIPVPTGPVSINIQSALVTSVFRLNGQAFPADAANSANFYLVPREGAPVHLGLSAEAPVPVRVLRGVYDVEYRWRAGNGVPRNDRARVLQSVSINGDTTITIDVPSQVVEGTLRMNGAVFPNGDANLFLQGVYGLGRVHLAATPQTDYSVRLIPGAYRFGYSAIDPGLFLPANRFALRERHNIDAVPGTLTLDLDLPSVLGTFQFRFDGAVPPNSIAESGQISIRTTEGDRIDLGETRQQNVGWRIIPGRYDVYYESQSSGAVAPHNRESRVMTNRMINAGANIINLTTMAVSGHFRINGAVLPQVNSESGRFFVRDRITGADTYLGVSAGGPFEVRLLANQSHDLVYERVSGSALVPYNERTVFESNRSFISPGDNTLDVPATWVTILPTLNGESFPDQGSESGRMYARGGLGDDDTYLGRTDGFANGLATPYLLINGTYAPLYEHLAGSGVVPFNTLATLDSPIHADNSVRGVLGIDVRPGTFTFGFRHNGTSFPASANQSAAFSLRHRDDRVDLDASNTTPTSRILIRNVAPLDDGRTGTIFYSWQAGGNSMPRNVDTPAACVMFDPD